jgi:hypothetical protein
MMGHRPDQGDRHRAAPVQDGRDDEADDDGERHGQGDQRPNPLPAAEGDHGQHEQRRQDQHGPAPLQITDVVEGWLAFLLQDGEPDLLAGPEACPGGVGGVEVDLLAILQPRPDLDAGGVGQARVGLLARHLLDLDERGADQPSRILLTSHGGPVGLAMRPQQDSAC